MRVSKWRRDGLRRSVLVWKTKALAGNELAGCVKRATNRERPNLYEFYTQR
jgi:hypothetical protein